MGVAVSKRTGLISFDGNLLFTFVTRGAQQTNLGHRLHYNLSASYRVGTDESLHHPHEAAAHKHLKWDLILAINGEWLKKQKTADVADEKSGGNLV